jgi:glycosyltransferase involved in cell wall biosynthesis
VSKEKNLDDFLAMEYSGTKVVVGDGAYRKELEERYPQVLFVGFQKGEDLAAYYANADCLVFPSRTDTFGVVIIEALAVGTPVAAYDVTGPVDILENGVTGFMSEDLKANIDACLTLDRQVVEKASMKWSWDNCWNVFRDNLVQV